MCSLCGWGAPVAQHAGDVCSGGDVSRLAPYAVAVTPVNLHGQLCRAIAYGDATALACREDLTSAAPAKTVATRTSGRWQMCVAEGSEHE
jgi:hypothetical protein